MNPLIVYIIAVASGNVAFFLCGGARLFWNRHGLCYDWPDPDYAIPILAFLLSPLPGLMSVAGFFLALRERIGGAHGTL